MRGRLATEAGDAATAVAEMEAFGKAYEDPAVSVLLPGVCVLDSTGRGSRTAS